jgi:periplasmic copper chaperone A
MSTSMRLLLPALTAVTLTLAAALSLARGQDVIAGDLAVTDAWARATPPKAELGAVYLRIENRGTVEDRLVAASSPVAQSATLHESVEENGVALMRPLAAAAVPAGGALDMEPGGAHVMLMGLAAPLVAGESVPLTLTFESSGAVDLSVPVLAIGADRHGNKHGSHRH